MSRDPRTGAGSMEIADVMEPWGWIGMAVWIGALFLLTSLVVRAPTTPPAEDALGILRARFARGEISQAEFEQARAALLADRQEVAR